MGLGRRRHAAQAAPGLEDALLEVRPAGRVLCRQHLATQAQARSSALCSNCPLLPSQVLLLAQRTAQPSHSIPGLNFQKEGTLHAECDM